MRHHPSIAAIAASAFLLAASPLRADNDAAKIAVGAAAILGVAALAHQNQHHKDDKHHNTAEKEAVYERGFQDGLHNASYHPDPNHESSYREGYDAGRPLGIGRGMRIKVNANIGTSKDRVSYEEELTKLDVLVRTAQTR